MITLLLTLLMKESNGVTVGGGLKKWIAIFATVIWQSIRHDL